MAGVVTVPRRDNASLRQIEFLPLSERRVLAILVVNRREVQNRILHTGHNYTAAQLEQAANFLNHRFAGLRLQQIRADLRAELVHVRSRHAAGGRHRGVPHGRRGAVRVVRPGPSRRQRYVRGQHLSLHPRH